MPAMNNILSKWIPVSERSRALSLVYSGMYLGSVTGLAVSPILIQKFKWPSVFYSFGSLGSIWFALWLNKVCLASLGYFSSEIFELPYSLMISIDDMKRRKLIFSDIEISMNMLSCLVMQYSLEKKTQSYLILGHNNM